MNERPEKKKIIQFSVTGKSSDIAVMLGVQSKTKEKQLGIKGS